MGGSEQELSTTTMSGMEFVKVICSIKIPPVDLKRRIKSPLRVMMKKTSPAEMAESAMAIRVEEG